MNPSSTDRIEKQIELNASPERIWQALTDHKQFGQWFGVELEEPFQVGKTTRGKISLPDGRKLVMEVVTQLIEPNRIFSFTWHPYAIDPNVDYSNEKQTLVEFRLVQIPTGTLLMVTESGFDAIPADRRDKAFRMNSLGWEIQMTNVQNYLSKMC